MDRCPIPECERPADVELTLDYVAQTVAVRYCAIHARLAEDLHNEILVTIGCGERQTHDAPEWP